MRTWLLALVLIGITTALAQDMTNGLNNPNNAVQLLKGGLNNPTIISSGGGGGPSPSFLLIQSGSIMLIQTGSKLEIHS